MAKLVWGSAGSRIYEIGVDRGVLYLNGVGYPWSGLISVDENTTSSDAREFYLDGVKYLNLMSLEDFSASIEAYGAPSQFLECDGGREVANGLIATQQRRTPFGFSYRTLIGNDTQGERYGYKLHLVYNAIVSSSNYQATTIGEKAEPVKSNWEVTTKPVKVGGLRQTAHYVVDSTKTPAPLLADVENILYGNQSNDAALIPATTLFSMFTNYVP